MQQIGESHCLRFGAFTGQGWNTWREFESKHQAKAAHVLNNGRILLMQFQQTFFEKLSDAPRILAEILSLNHLQDAQCDRTRQRRTTESGSMRSGTKQVSIRRANPKSAHRKSATERFGHRNAVRQECVWR